MLGNATDPGTCPQLAPFAVSVQGDLLAVREALRRVMAGLAPLRLDVEERGTVELVLAEVLNNVVEHAYPDTLEEAVIDVACDQRADGLHVLIRDRGRPMQGEQLPHITAAPADPAGQEMPEGGFGWWIIDSLTRDLHYCRSGDENRLSFRIAILR
ncbi:ATP-binding protein [Sulfitobacter sp. D35]|uniref:ATP-binding protein n=1 Tax=Sulfitobacter sp. D35 TaxID=3083252 RepID=UPI00296E7057|nr:ATP-binding protein [Sulfitobacter sp. D35]MDW4498356.1 ATP-binding protein [Sulfitobacter sp. D35]